MRRIPIHTKLIAALTVPLVALLVVVGLEYLGNSRDAREIRDQADLANVATGPGGLVSTLQDERNISATTLVGIPDLIQLPIDTIEDGRAASDRSLIDFEDKVLGNERARDVYADALEALEELDAIRADVDDFTGPRSLDSRPFAMEIFDRYSEAITALLDGNTRLASAINDAELRRGAELIDLASRQTDVVAHLVNRLINAEAEHGGLLGANGELRDRDLTAEIGGLFRQVERNRTDIVQLGTGKYTEAREKAIAESDDVGFIQLVPRIIESGDTEIAPILETVSPDRDKSYYGFRTAVEHILLDESSSIAAEAQQRVNLFLAVALGAIFLAVVVTYLVSRSITRPLRSLTHQATTMANDRLPDAVQDILETPLGEDVTVPHVDPIEVKTRDEVSDVAHALNTVQDSALELAVEQAVLRRNIADSFVNLGRRNQNLLGRQLDFITELEQNETDPDTLANLFRLDHLATRMRRNAESLLVLAGIDPPRKWAAPVRLTDVIRAALGEVEDYQRVTVRAVEAATISGSAAADLAHLLAELVENALIFSPPDQTVEIRGRTQPTGYTLAVIDSGLGMPPEEITRANRRLAGAESFTIAPSKYLGHYVAGNLAARHNIDVQLHNSPGSGVTATVHLPADVLSSDPAGAGGDGPGGLQLGPSPQAPPAGFAPGGPSQAPGLPQRQPAAGMTESGLARRTPSGPRPDAPSPDDDLLRVLANYTGLDQPGGDRPPADATISPVTGTPALSELPPFPLTPPEGTPSVGPYPQPQQSPPQQPGGLQAPDHQPSGTGPSARQQPSGPQRPGGPPPPLARRGVPTGQTPAIRPPGQAPGAPAGPLPARGRGAPPTGQTPAARAPGAPAGPPPARGRGAPTGQTPAVPPIGTPAEPPGGGGLTRRVRGAQMPNTQPPSLQRGPGGNGGPGPGAPGGPAMPPPAPQEPPGTPGSTAAQGWANQSAAKNVYSFLSDFTSGVKRGLSDAQGEPPSKRPDGEDASSNGSEE